MTTYCLNADVVNRLSNAGALYCVDDDRDGTLDASESLLIDDAIEAVSAEIDGYLTPIFETVPIVQSAGSLNRWLRDRCVDLACERLCGRKGKQVVASIAEPAARSREWLENVADKTMRVPGLTYPGDGFISERRLIGRPVVGNPRGCV
mgnify:CR=1 FL=1